MEICDIQKKYLIWFYLINFHIPGLHIKSILNNISKKKKNNNVLPNALF